MTVEQFIKSVEREQGPLRRFLRTLCRGDAAKADDIAQEALLKAYLHFNDFNGRSRFSTWLYRIAFNSFSDWSVAAAWKEKGRDSLDAPSAFLYGRPFDCGNLKHHRHARRDSEIPSVPSKSPSQD